MLENIVYQCHFLIHSCSLIVFIVFCSRSANLIAGRVNCSGQIIPLQCFDKVSDEIKTHKVRSEFQPSFIVKLLYYNFCNCMEHVLIENKVNFTNLVNWSDCSLYWHLSWRAVNLQINCTVKYQGAFSRIMRFAGKPLLFSPPVPPSIFLLLLLLSCNNWIGNAQHATQATEVNVRLILNFAKDISIILSLIFLLPWLSQY